MKPEILAILITVVGFTINAMWTIHNLHVRNEIQGMVAGLKEYMEREFIGREIYNEQHEEILRRLTQLES